MIFLLINKNLDSEWFNNKYIFIEKFDMSNTTSQHLLFKLIYLLDYCHWALYQ
jgi:hypothetical protein